MTAATSPRIVLGLPLYNNAGTLPESLESLLGQTRGDFAIVALDDCSFDATPELMQHYAQLDERIHYEKNASRLGLVGNWRSTFERGRELYPDAEFFAWVSDHDTWHPRWLEGVTGALDGNANAVVAYSRAVAISEGRVVQRPADFDTDGVGNPWRRARASWSGMSAGYMVYGLYRVDPLEASGVYLPLREPDRLLLFELSLRGEFVQTPGEHYLRRRTTDKPTAARQLRSFFPDGVPLTAYAPWWLTHSWALARHLTVRPPAGMSRTTGARAALMYLPLAVRLNLRRRMWSGLNVVGVLAPALALRRQWRSARRRGLSTSARRAVRQLQRAVVSRREV